MNWILTRFLCLGAGEGAGRINFVPESWHEHHGNEPQVKGVHGYQRFRPKHNTGIIVNSFLFESSFYGIFSHFFGV